MNRDAFATRLREELDAQLTLSHPIFNELLAPERNWPLLKMITLEGYQITRYFQTYIENLHFRCSLPTHKRRLLINLFERETGHFSRTRNHVALMQDFIRSQGISDTERDAHQPSPQTRELIDYRLNAVTRKDTYHIGAAAILIASEGQAIETRDGAPRDQLLRKVYGFSQEDTLFFSVHQQEDAGHVQEGIELVADLCVTETQQGEALVAVRHTCRLFWNMYEGVAQKYWRMKPPKAAAPRAFIPSPRVAQA